MDTRQKHSGTLEPAFSAREYRAAALARRAAAESIVLLTNDGILPLLPTAAVALLGCGAQQTVKGGTGSGDVNNRRNRSIWDGLCAAGVKLTGNGWLADYEQRCAQARQSWKETILEDAKKVANPFDSYAAHPFRFPEGRAVGAEDLRGAEVAVYVINRISGEGNDRRLEKGDYYLSDRETADLAFLNSQNLPTVLLINAGGVVELTDVLAACPCIRAVAMLSQLGQEGGDAVADVLLGKVSPSGRLTASWPRRYSDLPCAESFGALNGDLSKEEYRDGIYVGYRYFDAFHCAPLFAFGHGLSYTTFAVRPGNVEQAGRTVVVRVNVQNTGNHEGCCVVQCYTMLTPTGNLAKEPRRLAAFGKTKLLPPGESETLCLRVPQKQLAVYDEGTQDWLVEKGIYGLLVGERPDLLVPAALLYVTQTTVIEHCAVICGQPIGFCDLVAPPADATAPWIAAARDCKVPELTFSPLPEQAAASPATQEHPIPVERLLSLLCGNITEGAGNLGASGIQVPGSAGETTAALQDLGVPALIMADGPAGLRLQQNYEVDLATDTVYDKGVLGALENGRLGEDIHHANAARYYQYCTAFPVGTALAQSWDAALLVEIGQAIAVEMQEFGVDLWLAPGMNIQRNPLCGRNFEYYSEDPLLSGKLAAAITRGVQRNWGCGVTIKHFACNNQEDNRMSVDCRVSQRALHELYFRGFEIAVKEAAPLALMTSYNLINGVHAANSADLCTTLLRGEWGFDGLVMSDWCTTAPSDGSVPWKCPTAGNDLIMPGAVEDLANLRVAYQSGQLSEQVVRCCAGHILSVIRRLRGRPPYEAPAASPRTAPKPH